MTTVEDILKKEGLVETKPYGVTVIVCDHSNGVVDQKITITEGSWSGPENIYKYQWICDAILEALNGTNVEGSGGVFREMGEDFQETMDQLVDSGEVELDPINKAIRDSMRDKGRGQGKPNRK